MPCFFFAGQYVQSAAEKAAASDKNGTPATPSEAAVQSGALTATPSFLFPSVASYSDAEPANAEMMRPDQLNLAWLYEEGEDSSQPSDSMAGKLYNKLAVKDAQWISGIYDLYNYTPEQAAPLLGLPIEAVTAPSGIIEDFKRIQVQFTTETGRNPAAVPMPEASSPWRIPSITTALWNLWKIWTHMYQNYGMIRTVTAWNWRYILL